MTTKPEIRELPQLDTDLIERDAAAYVADKLPLLDAEQVAAATARIIHTEDRNAEKARAERDRAAYTLERDYRLRRGANLAGAMGVQRSRLMVIRRKMKDLDDKGEFKPVEHADRVLARAAFNAAKAAARAAAAEVHRDAAVVALDAAGWKGAQIAKLIGTDPSRVSHIIHRDDDEAKGAA